MIRRELPKGMREDHFVISWTDDWIQLNVSQSIEDINFWLRAGLCISAVINGNTITPDPWKFNSSFTDDLAFVMVWSSENLSLPQMKTRRSSRRDKFRDSALIHSSFSRNRVKFSDRCTLQPLFIDFRDLAWETWIIAPPGLELGTCSGVCMRDDISTNYNIIIDSINRDPDLHRLYSLAGIRSERCCAPTQFLPAVIMFVDERQKIVVQLVEDILVGGCGCV
uniref:TGF_beta domain-containing protein n=2 Tax=Bathyctena chuni TaxID=1403704 RepID=V9PPB9_BATCU|nr:TGF_beta domain-containing protein [Bathyctena chuni]